jgi:hypothetical protein
MERTTALFIATVALAVLVGPRPLHACEHHIKAIPGSADTHQTPRVTLAKVHLFEAQVRKDLPIGTSRHAVEAYLDRARINHHYFDSDYAVDANSIHFIIKNIGERWGYTANLQGWVYLDPHERVRVIKFLIQYDAP